MILVGLAGAFFFCVFVQHVSPGAFAAGLTLLTGTADVIVSLIKAALFGLAAGLIACYKGISVGGGPAGVGNAVNETVVFTFMALFAINVIVTAVGPVQGDDVTHRAAVPAVHRGCGARSRGVADGWNRIGRQTQFYGKTLAVDPRRRHPLPDRAAAADRSDGPGHRGAGGHRRHRRDRRLPHADHRRAGRGAGLQPAGVRDRRRSADRLRVGVLQRPADRAGDHVSRACRRPSAPAPPLSWARCGSTRRSTRSR